MGKKTREKPSPSDSIQYTKFEILDLIKKEQFLYIKENHLRYCPRIRDLTPPSPPVKMEQQRTALWLAEQLRTALWLVSSLAASYCVVQARQFQAAPARTRRARGSCSYKVDCTDRRFNSQLLPIKGLGAFPWSDGGPTLAESRKRSFLPTNSF